ncbi:metallophosphoesterase family protein [Paenibacillus pini]|uniref:Serine/threonine protein phosphatase n=1 Tax=Paenibacillus pini JCM 16418 TaxID=1236976 RepID=W7Y6R6_9BACL|nr:metallophosphoesterase family protein [Paenibacillus pini]GAF06600.1 serine/threonine protein phosphatase [Paenibacillus pini JCM 16418]
MKKIAIISDIHGNMPALQAVLQDIEHRKIETVYCLGDLIGKGPSGDIVTDLIQERCEKVVRGNWDEFISMTTDVEPLKWHQEKLGSDRLKYLSSLPITIEFVMSGKYIRLFHASPRSIYERIQSWDDQEVRSSLFTNSELCINENEADVVGYGDIHNAYIQHFQGKTLFNVGSVGNPLEITQASYVILEGSYDVSTPSPLSIQFVRVPYDIELSIQHAIEAEMPLLKEYISELRTDIPGSK